MPVCIKVLVFLLLTVLNTPVVLLTNTSYCQDNEEQDVCITSQCVETAATILSKMDQTVDPCQDFYQFACGRWIRENMIPDDRSSLDTIFVLQQKVDNTIRRLLEQESGDDEKDFIKKAKTLYASCMDLETINAKGADPLVSFVQSNFGGWPIANESWDESQFDLQDAITNVFAMNRAAFFQILVYTDLKESTKRALYIDQPGFVLPEREYYLKPRNDPILEAYEDRIAATAQLMLGDTITVDRDQAREIVDFEIELAKISVPSGGGRDPDSVNNPTNLTDLQRDYGEIVNWVSLINDLFGMDGVNDSIADDEVIINLAPSYFSNLTELLDNTPNRVKANYMVWQVVASMSDYLSEDFLEIIQMYNEDVFGMATTVRNPRYQTCKWQSTKRMGLAFERLFIEEKFNAESKAEVMDMIDNLQAAFNGILDDMQWMDNSTKEVAKEINHYILRSIGYQDIETKDTAISSMFENYMFSADDWFSNMVGAVQESFKENLRSLRLPVDPIKEWWLPSYFVSAFYSKSDNQIRGEKQINLIANLSDVLANLRKIMTPYVVPAGILQPPLFSIQYPRSVNYGAIGSFIAQKILLGFDDRGGHFDKNGNFVQWWNKSSVTEFEDRAQCMVEQYGSFFYEEANMTINGVDTLDTNIADNGGLKESFTAYRNWVAKQGKEESKLPGLDLTHDQVFFLGFSQMLCGKESKKSALRNTLLSWQTPRRFRVIGALQNSQEFANAFQCHPGSFMNPTNKCSVW